MVSFFSSVCTMPMFAFKKKALHVSPQFYFSVDPLNVGERYFGSKQLKKISFLCVLTPEFKSLKFIQSIAVGSQISPCPLYFQCFVVNSSILIRPNSLQHKVQTSERISTLYCAYVFVVWVFRISHVW